MNFKIQIVGKISETGKSEEFSPLLTPFEKKQLATEIKILEPSFGDIVDMQDGSTATVSVDRKQSDYKNGKIEFEVCYDRKFSVRDVESTVSSSLSDGWGENETQFGDPVSFYTTNHGKIKVITEDQKIDVFQKAYYFKSEPRKVEFDDVKTISVLNGKYLRGVVKKTGEKPRFLYYRHPLDSKLVRPDRIQQFSRKNLIKGDSLTYVKERTGTYRFYKNDLVHSAKKFSIMFFLESIIKI
jgi:hypothetical protein